MFVQKSILLSRHNQETAQWSPDPFPRERAGSGHETNRNCTGSPYVPVYSTARVRNAEHFWRLCGKARPEVMH